MQIKLFRTSLKPILFVFVTLLSAFAIVEPVYAMNTSATWDQEHFWFRDDDGTESGASGYGTGDLAVDAIIGASETFAVGQAFRLRITLLKDNNGDIDLVTTPQLEFMASASGCLDAGSWTTVPTQPACSGEAFCQTTNSNSWFADGDSTTRQTDIDHTHVGGDMVETDGGPSAASFSGGTKIDHAEWEVMLDSDNAVGGTVYTFRLAKSGGTPYGTYATCPTLETDTVASTTYWQDDFRFYVTANSVTLSNVWPPGTGTDLLENGALTQIPATNDPMEIGDQIRIQTNFEITGADLAATTHAYELEYGAGVDCTAVSSWSNVGAKASGTIWRLFDETGIGDSTAQLDDLGSSTASAAGYYSEIIPSSSNPNAVLAATSENSEWDWPVENNGAAENTSYCFRMVIEDGGTGTLFNNYNADSYPRIVTAPGMSNFLRHGNIFSDEAERGFYWAN